MRQVQRWFGVGIIGLTLLVIGMQGSPKAGYAQDGDGLSAAEQANLDRALAAIQGMDSIQSAAFTYYTETSEEINLLVDGRAISRTGTEDWVNLSVNFIREDGGDYNLDGTLQVSQTSREGNQPVPVVWGAAVRRVDGAVYASILTDMIGTGGTWQTITGDDAMSAAYPEIGAFLSAPDAVTVVSIEAWLKLVEANAVAVEIFETTLTDGSAGQVVLVTLEPSAFLVSESVWDEVLQDETMARSAFLLDTEGNIRGFYVEVSASATDKDLHATDPTRFAAGYGLTGSRRHLVIMEINAVNEAFTPAEMPNEFR